ncbi:MULTISPECIES: hypothetical protein [Pectobacterium]|uniref:hypothetical protein n=1 Tax=Pectobacterium TaxID=122277 RepID=UPI000F8F44CE|nr:MULTISPECIES: hypothetical protein [Pectobacterium]MCL6375502.1 hypothetical protein [Pectobacterium atrosepticum]RUR87886.1 hypothetical protein PB16LOC_04286 [Pectobacterium versatile]
MATDDYIFWTFTAAAQSVAAFIAILLTGYTLGSDLLRSWRAADESLEEVEAALKRKVHRQLTVLAVVTGFSIILSLFIVYLNGEYVIPVWAQAITGLLVCASIVGALWFVITLIDPDKYKKAAKAELQDSPGEDQASQPSDEFFKAFIALERSIRSYLREQHLYVPSRGAPKMSYSFRQMVDALLFNERIDSSFRKELMEINKYRNLVFHGHLDHVDPRMTDRAKTAVRKIDELSDA